VALGASRDQTRGCKAAAHAVVTWEDSACGLTKLAALKPWGAGLSQHTELDLPLRVSR
jgi:hypothetical protein